MKSFVSNTCIGYMTHQIINKSAYNNPFVGSLIVNDEDFVKLSGNFLYYMRQSPKFGLPNSNSVFAKQSGNCWYQHRLIKKPYPVMYLDDIEIHWIHEKSEEECLEKYNKRRLRYAETKPENYFLLSYSELLNNHDNVEEFIERYLKSNKNAIFLGPSKYNKFNKNYIGINRWNNIELLRDASFVYKFNNQNLSVEYLKNFLS